MEDGPGCQPEGAKRNSQCDMHSCSTRRVAQPDPFVTNVARVKGEADQPGGRAPHAHLIGRPGEHHADEGVQTPIRTTAPTHRCQRASSMIRDQTLDKRPGTRDSGLGIPDSGLRTSDSLASANQGHLRRHHGHELHVRFERQAGHVDAPPARRARRPSSARPSSCRWPADALGHPGGHLGRGVADVDLTAGDVVGAAVERGGLGQAGDRVLGRGVGRGVRPRRRAPRSSRC